MSATLAPEAIFPPTLAELVADAELASRDYYAQLTDPTADLPGTAVLSTVTRPLVVDIPPFADERRKRIVACRWLPSLIAGTRASACLLVEPSWLVREPDEVPVVSLSEHPERQEGVSFIGHDDAGGSVARLAVIQRFPDGTSALELDDQERGDDHDFAGIWANALAAALGDYASDCVATCSHASHVVGFRFADMGARERALATLAVQGEDWVGYTTWPHVTEPYVTICGYDRYSAQAVRAVLAATGTEETPDAQTMRAVLGHRALINPLMQVGFTEEDIRSPRPGAILDVELYASLGAAMTAAGWDVGRNDPCPCHSGRKFKRCCGDMR